MPRDDVIALMKQIKLISMPKIYDEVLASAQKRRHTPATVIETLLQAEVAERDARSIRYRMTQAKFPLPKELD
jgi:DNA replication protein DnaC